MFPVTIHVILLSHTSLQSLKFVNGLQSLMNWGIMSWDMMNATAIRQNDFQWDITTRLRSMQIVLRLTCSCQNKLFMQ